MNKKIFITFSLILIFLYILSSSSFASSPTLTYTFEDKSLGLPDISTSQPMPNNFDPKYYFVYFANNNYWLFVSECPCYLYSEKGKWNYVYKCNFQEGRIVNFILDKGSTSWRYNQSQDCPYSFTNSVFNPSNHSTSLIYANYDIKYNDKVVFQAYCPSELVRTVKSMDTLNTVMKDVVSVLPVTLTILVGLICIRKAISFIQKKLRSA